VLRLLLSAARLMVDWKGGITNGRIKLFGTNVPGWLAPGCWRRSRSPPLARSP
jgi:hypothetical protein